MTGMNLTLLTGATALQGPRALYFHETLDKVDKEAVVDWQMKLIRNTNMTNQ